MTLDPVAQMTQRMWRRTFFFSAGVFFFFVFYVSFIDPVFNLGSLSKCLIGTSGILFCASLSLSSFGYYFDFLDKAVSYRKYLGLIGYFYALVDMFLLFFTHADYYVFGLWDHLFTADLMLGITAMGIFTAMALISNNRAMQWLGPTRWRSFLRLGYVALFCLMLRAMVLEGTMWHAWIADPVGPPPVRLVLSFLITGTLFARLSVAYNEWRKKRSVPLPSQPPVPAV